MVIRRGRSGRRRALAVVHLLTVGWFGLLMSGALLQFVPVLVAQPLRWGTRCKHWFAIVLGDISLVGGFAALGLCGGCQFRFSPLVGWC